MRIYVASKFENYPAVRAFNERLRNLGHEISYDWTLTDEFDENGVFLDRAADDIDMERYALLDLEGVLSADLLVLLADYDGLNGALWEAGMAAGARKPVIVVAPRRYAVFHDLPWVRVVNSEESAIAILTMGGILQPHART